MLYGRNKWVWCRQVCEDICEIGLWFVIDNKAYPGIYYIRLLDNAVGFRFGMSSNHRS